MRLTLKVVMQNDGNFVDVILQYIEGAKSSSLRRCGGVHCGAASRGPRIVDHTVVAVAWWDWENCEKCSLCLWIRVNVKCIRSVKTAVMAVRHRRWAQKFPA